MSTTALHLRDATRDDLPALAALYLAADLDQAATDPERLAAAWAAAIAHPGTRVRVAEADGQLAGSYMLYVLPLLAHGGTPAAVVDDVAVHPALQGQGIGRRLMADAMALAAQAGCYKLALSSNRRREGAHAFYRALGFEQHGLSFRVTPAAPADVPEGTPPA
jgi:GNAT superfamily N-acetyltransferase